MAFFPEISFPKEPCSSCDRYIVGLPCTNRTPFEMKRITEAKPLLDRVHGENESNRLRGKILHCHPFPKKKDHFFHPFIDNPIKTRQKEPQCQLNEYKTLDAPGLINNPYASPIAISPGDLLSIALGKDLHTYDLKTHKVTSLGSEPDDKIISSLKWLSQQQFVFGTENGKASLFDANKRSIIHEIETSQSYINALESGPQPDTMYIGNKNGKIAMVDFRTPEEDIPTISETNHGEVSALALSPNHWYLASGHDQNVALVTDIRKENIPVAVFEDHQGAVSDVNWLTNNYLFSASRDKTIKIHQIYSKKLHAEESTDSPVYGLHFDNHGELFSIHGFDDTTLPSNQQYKSNSIKQWRVEKSGIRHINTVRVGHTAPLMYSEMNKDKSVLITASPDDRINFWEGFLPQPKPKKIKSTFSKYIIR